MLKLLIPRDAVGSKVYTKNGFVVASDKMSEAETLAVAETMPSWVVKENVEPVTPKQNGGPKGKNGEPAAAGDTPTQNA